MSEVDVHGAVLHSFTDVNDPTYLALDDEGRVFVADKGNDRILVLDSEVRRVIARPKSKLKLEAPWRLCRYDNEPTSQLYVAHTSSALTLFNLGEKFSLCANQ